MLNGKVISDTPKLEAIYVINKTAATSTATQRGGYFTIAAQPQDTLVLSSSVFNPKTVVLTEKDFTEDLYFVSMEPMDILLEELVIVDYSYINSEALGLVPAGQKRYTPAERRVATAASWKMNPLGLDPLFNAISGRTTMLKNAAENDKKVTLMDNVSLLYSTEDITAQLKVPAEYVRGFLFYAVENKYFVKLMEANDIEKAKFTLAALAEKYNKLLAEE
ncbi:hypothetical protein AM493_11295 [Flavobacterium akiainvivens]|uniref:Uncharacterized protein n=2 Tax=Flavobacterium akiainvivens TaxID=1202724 RepID=A0A0M8MBD1_9FLAO|nr:hypothetical protein AM493_11295 [Flavobacterium akiainvivens]